MKKLALAVLLFTSPAWAATAYWTGRMEHITTVTYKAGVNCEYRYGGNTFWRSFVGAMCPNSVQVD